GRVGKRFALHHVAPVAGVVADGKEDRLLVATGLFECLLAPRVPVHGVVSVKKQVRALLVSETILSAAFLGRSRGVGWFFPFGGHRGDISEANLPAWRGFQDSILLRAAFQEILLPRSRARFPIQDAR